MRVYWTDYLVAWQFHRALGAAKTAYSITQPEQTNLPFLIMQMADSLLVNRGPIFEGRRGLVSLATTLFCFWVTWVLISRITKRWYPLSSYMYLQNILCSINLVTLPVTNTGTVYMWMTQQLTNDRDDQRVTCTHWADVFIGEGNKNNNKVSTQANMTSQSRTWRWSVSLIYLGSS